MLSFLLVRLHTDESVLKSVADYGDVSVIYAYFVLFNVILAYGMETAFFRFYNSPSAPGISPEEEQKKKSSVVSTSGWSLFSSSFAVLGLAFLARENISVWTEIPVQYISFAIGILLLDALVIIP